MVDTSCTELRAHRLCSRKTKIGDSEAQPAIETEYILRFQVTMINIERMAIFNRIKQLKKYLFNKKVVAQITTMVKDLSEEIAIFAVIHDDKCVLIVFDDAVESNNVGVRRCELVEGNLTKV